MRLEWEVIFVVLFCESLIVSLLLNPLMKKLSGAIGLVDHPGERKVHTTPTPLSGGIAIYLSFVVVTGINILLALWLLNTTNLFHADVSKYVPNVAFRLRQAGLIFLGATLMFVTGVIDDRRTLNPWLKLVLQILSAALLCVAGIRIGLFIASPAVGVVLTLGWVVLLTNSFNFLDNMDGLASGIALIILAVLGALSYLSEEWFMVAFIAVFAGALLGFWRYNFFGHKIFMGDSGSLFVGYIIAAITILITYYKRGVPTALPVLSPLIILGVPLFDTLSVLLIRIRRGAPLMQGDTNHFSHRLVSLGMTHRQAVAFIYIVTFCVAINALPLRYLNLRNSIIVAIQTILIFVIIYFLEKVGKRT